MAGRSADRDEGALLGEQRPDDAGVLGGDGDDGAVVATALAQCHGPAGEAIGFMRGGLQYGAGAEHEQGSQIGVAAFGDAAESGLAAGGMLPGTRPSQAANWRAELNSWPVATRQ